MKILRFTEYLNESVYAVGVPVYRGNSFDPEVTIKRNRVLDELQKYLSQVASGTLTEVTLVADIPLHGKNMPSFVRDVYAEAGFDPTKERELGGEPSKNVFVDSEFLVKDVDLAKGVVIATPYSLRRKEIMVEIAPEIIEEIFVK
jgi:hypothetical protein